ncbi:MAG TPA: ribosome small subunit-dependent GTPase A [Acidimicrobiales bacterium]|nr:ribosome small subunit-dependent GTPase A [Acidimicrobiales bacterium]
MPNDFPDALVAYGWSERVAALYQSVLTAPSARPGRVVRVERGVGVAIGTGGEETDFHLTIPVAAGDWVVLDGERLTDVLPRRSALQRQDPETGDAQVLAANVDLVLITVPADRLNANRAERELALAWESGALPVVLLTKADLAPAGLSEELATRLVGVHILPTSTGSDASVKEVAALFAPDRTGVFLGPSGAGKSSLTNALLGYDRQSIGSVREGDRRGRHTTTSRHLLTLPGGGVVIDTPGLRSLGLVSGDHLGMAFPDIEDLASQCRFANCMHDREPGCAITEAVAHGTLAAQRLASYRKLAKEAAAERVRTDPLAHRGAKRLWGQRAIDSRRYDKRRPSS